MCRCEEGVMMIISDKHKHLCCVGIQGSNVYVQWYGKYIIRLILEELILKVNIKLAPLCLF